MNWYDGLKGRIIFNEPLSRHTGFKIGLPASLWIEPYDLDDLRDLIKRTKLNKIEYFVIGLGSNLLIKKKNIPLAIHLGSPSFKKILVKGNEVTVGSGIALGRLINALARCGLGGLEFLSGIPGNVGGALVMNAGVGWPKRSSIGDFVQCAEVLDKNGNRMVLGRKCLKFAYRSSNLSRFIICGAKLRLEKKPSSEIHKGIKRFWEHKRLSQDLRWPSAGCVFKNPQGESAGRLIDLCGLKGTRIGDAVVSNKHANFIINQGKASADDVVRLIRLIRRKVRKKFKLNLEAEIQVI